jgi:hypothetical protein
MLQSQITVPSTLSILNTYRTKLSTSHDPGKRETGIEINEYKTPGRVREETKMGANKIPKDKAPVKIDQFARMEANMVSREEKIRTLFGVDINTATAREINNCDATMSRWRRHPKFDDIWKDEVRSQEYADYSEARKVLRQGMRQSDGWLAMNSAVNVLSNANKRLFHDEDTAVTVKIEGLPDIGSPDSE